MSIFQIYKLLATIVYLFISVMCVWSIFIPKNANDGKHAIFMRQIGYAMIMVPFLLRALGIK